MTTAQPPDSDPVVHHFTVDVEEYFHAAALEPHLHRLGWDALESRVEESTDRILALLDASGSRGTFFVLGWLAERKPWMVRRIAREGHEIASHGWGHRKVTDLDREGFRKSVRRSRNVLEEITGASVLGYRAPNFSVVPGVEWALDVLLEEGYRYDSSIFPIRRPGYGYPGADRTPHRIRRHAGTIVEFPPATLRVWGMNLPAAGGAYFRVLPFELVRKAFEAAEREGTPGTFYIHPWELDPGQPRMPLPLLTRLRHYGGLEQVEERLEGLLGSFRFGTLAGALEELEGMEASPRPEREGAPLAKATR